MLIVVGAHVPLACGQIDDARVTADAPDAMAKAPDPSHVHGAITVHCNPGGRAFLADGSGFDELVPPSGVVVFADSSIVGPQTVSCAAAPGRAPNAALVTMAGVNRGEVFLGAAYSLPPNEPPMYRVTGNLSLVPAAAADVSFITEFWRGAYGAIIDSVASGNGPYSLSIRSDRPFFDLIGVAEGPAHERLGVGMRRLAIPADAATPDGGPLTVSGADIAIDHAFDQVLRIDATNLQDYSDRTSATLFFSRDDVLKLRLDFDEAIGATRDLRVFAQTPPFDEFKATLSVGTHSASADAAVQVPLAIGARSASVTFPPRPSIVEPKTVELDSPLPSPRVPIAPGSFRLAWQDVDPSAQTVLAEVSCGSGPLAVAWSVIVPADAGSFTFFTPPADTAIPFFCSNAEVQIVLNALAVEGATPGEVSDFFLSGVDLTSRFATRTASVVARFHAP